jgi:predicted transcriptional regulator
MDVALHLPIHPSSHAIQIHHAFAINLEIIRFWQRPISLEQLGINTKKKKQGQSPSALQPIDSI